MGVLGVGKIIFLDVLVVRKNIGVIYGDILVDGVKLGKEFQCSILYVEQFDVYDLIQIVCEVFWFLVDLCQFFEIFCEEKYIYVEEIIVLLEMEMFVDVIIGLFEVGFIVEQCKRVIIGVEFVVKFELFLFFDELIFGFDF